MQDAGGAEPTQLQELLERQQEAGEANGCGAAGSTPLERVRLGSKMICSSRSQTLKSVWPHPCKLHCFSAGGHSIAADAADSMLEERGLMPATESGRSRNDASCPLPSRPLSCPLGSRPEPSRPEA